MKKIILVLVGICVFCLGVVGFVNSRKYNPERVCQMLDNMPVAEGEFPFPGEKLTYVINYMYAIDVAWPVVTTGPEIMWDQKRAYPVTLFAKTGAFASRICEAYAKIKSIIDLENNHTLRYEETSQAAGHSLNEKIILYDQQNHIMTFENQKRVIPENTQDPLSLLMFLRSQNLSVGKKINAFINSNQENYLVESEVLSLVVVGGTAEPLKLWHVKSRVSSHKEYSSSRAGIDAWITADHRRIPVFIRAGTMAGIVVAALSDVSYSPDLRGHSNPFRVRARESDK